MSHRYYIYFLSTTIIIYYVIFLPDFNTISKIRYNLGNGVIILTSLEKISLNEYHKVSAKRYHRDGILTVDDMEDVAGQSDGNLKALDLADDAFIGSVPSNYTR